MKIKSMNETVDRKYNYNFPRTLGNGWHRVIGTTYQYDYGDDIIISVNFTVKEMSILFEVAIEPGYSIGRYNVQVFDTGSLEGSISAIEYYLNKIPKILSPLFAMLRPVLINPGAGSILYILSSDKAEKVLRDTKKNLDRLF